ncbi:SAM-dependent methyltransferase [Spirillospora sp. NPDC029432]|uniref:SAM-dependent methyltransferase n=1 Tax=Spirillospora sp. NPDC029432 TaxID=3154599 RepID=UPI0034540CE3
MVDTQGAPTDLHTDRPHPARVYDYWLGGKDNFAADRELAERMLQVSPLIPGSARANRAFLRRAVRKLVEEAGIRQFLDIGSGLPTQENVHLVAQRLAPESRVVYVDNDPIVLSHGRALLQSTSQGRTEVVHGDVRDPDGILGDPVVQSALDFDRPIGVLINAVLHFVSDDEDPAGLVARYRDAVVPGSHLLIAQSSWELHPPESVEAAQRETQRTGFTVRFRDRDEILPFFDGLELLDPGLVPICDWHPDGPVPDDHRLATLYGGLARVP